jgi:hypothetical protein
MSKTLYLNRCDDQVILLVRGMRAKDQAMNGVVLALGSRHVGQPLSCQTGPFLQARGPKLILMSQNCDYHCIIRFSNRVQINILMFNYQCVSHNQVVEEGSVLLPDLVLLVNNSLLDSLILVIFICHLEKENKSIIKNHGLNCQITIFKQCHH